MSVVLTYLIYLLISIGLTVGVGWALARSGRTFLLDVFDGNDGLAEAVNRLLVVGFYLLNLGYACLLLKAKSSTNAIEAIEVLAYKLGALLLSLGGMHFFNLYLFHRIRRRAQLSKLPPPVVPTLQLATK